MPMEDFKQLASRYPELFKAPISNTLHFLTLQKLKLKSGAEASARGYLLVRPRRSTRTRSCPGLWLHPSDAEALRNAVALIESKRLRSKSTSTAKQATQRTPPAGPARNAAALVQHWSPGKPPWFAQEKLEAWAHKAEGLALSHPLLALGNADSFFKAAKCGIATFGGLPTRVDLDPNSVIAKVWGLASLGGKKPFDRLQAIASQMAASHIETEILKFCNAHPHGDAAKSVGASPRQWQALCEDAFTQTLGPQFSAKASRAEAAKRLREKLAVAKLEDSAKRCRSELPNSIKDFYPLARSLERKLTFIYGPTNSGKTYQALRVLASAPSGAYLGPLRLLALEIFDKLNAGGIPTSLATGELVEEVPGATHTAATIEMLDVTSPVDTIVIDEVQLLNDRDRGSAWLHAVLGAPARHVILVGSAAALPAVRQLATLTREPLAEIALERLNPLKILATPADINNLPKGSALIVFSRQAALSYAHHLREQQQRRVSVIYGALSPEVRKEQARQFREGITDIVVATDAIGMGLNLPIHTVIFTTAIKWNGKAEVPLERALTWQIAGRAGRYGLHESGDITALDAHSLALITQNLSTPPEALKPPFFYGLTLPIAQAIARQLQSDRLSHILSFFTDRLHLENWAVSRVSEDQRVLAEITDDYPELTLAARLTLSHAPARHARLLSALFKPYIKSIVEAVSQGCPQTPEMVHGKATRLEVMEARVRELTLYSWMHYRWPRFFPEIEEAQSRLQTLNDAITHALALEPGKRCKECAKPMPWNSPFGLCESCYSDRREYREESWAH